MEQTVLALFRKELQVDQALAELQEQGFSSSLMKSFSKIGTPRDDFHIATIDSKDDDRISDMKSTLYKALREWGVPQDDALLFTEAVRLGGHLAVVFAGEDKVDLVTRTLKLRGALDLNARKKFAEEERLRPTQGLQASPFTKIEQKPNAAHDFAEWLVEHKGEIGPRSAVRIYELPPHTEDMGTSPNLNE